MKVQELFKLGMKKDINDLLDMPKGIHLNVGAGKSIIPNAKPFDLPEWNVNYDSLPYRNGAVAGIHAYHFLEHCDNPIAVLQEFQRVLQTGGVVNIVVPYYTSSMYAQDLTHKHPFCEDTWKILFNNPYTLPQIHNEWLLMVHVNFIMGIAERNLALFTQMIKQSITGDQG